MSIPNIISAFRILLIPLVIGFLFIDFANHYYFALGLYLLAMISDLLDGYIARKYKLETKLGRFLDPLADKTMNILMMVTLACLQIFPLWIVLLQIARDLFVDAVINLQASLKMFNSAAIGAKLRTLFVVLAISTGIVALIDLDQNYINIAYYLLIASFIVGFIGIRKPSVLIAKTILKKLERE
jgi:CDP-diacylglycerol--glycerol-3-phosphate 3-phosphatidyltransferase